MTVTVNVPTKESTITTMDPKHMIGSVYGTPTLVVPTICMNVRPNTTIISSVKKPVEPLKTSSLRKLIPIISGLLTFATVLSVLTICMDTSGELLMQSATHIDISKYCCRYPESNLILLNPSFRNSFTKIPLEYDS